MDAGTLKQRLEQFPSHFHWKLEDQSERERTDLRNRIEGGLAEHPDKLPVCYMTLVGYLWVSPLDKKEHFKNALQWFHKASEINSVAIEQESKRGNKGPIGDKIILLTNKAMLQLKLGMHNSVKKLYKEIEKLFQEKTPEIEAYITAHKAFASRQFGPAKYNIAAELFKEALECFPENVDWLEEYGKVIGRIERNMELADCAESSERVLEQVIKLDPSRHLSRVLLAQIYQDKKLYDAAEEQIDTAIKLTKGKLRITVMQRIGQFYRKQRRFDEALTCFEEVRTANPKSVFNLDQMALTYKAKSYAVRNTHQSHVFLETALKLCQEACDISEENSDVKLTMAHILLLFGRHSDARICYAELSETAGAGIKSKVHFRFGQFLDRIGDKPDAIEQYISAIRCNHESFFGKKAVDKIFEMKNILHSELGNDRALDILGWVHSKLGDLKTAVFYYETEWETNHTDELREVLIDLHLKLRNIEKTKHYLKDVKESESVDKLKGRHHNLVGEEENKLGKIAVARKEFSISTQYFCLDGAENLIRILTKCSIEQTCENEWFTDCAKIADFIANDHEQTENLKSELNKINVPKYENLMKLYEMYIRFLQKHDEFSDAITVLGEARKTLDRSFKRFEKCHYTYNKDHHFRLIHPSSTKSAEELVEDALTHRCKWVDFRKRFPNLFKSILEVQPVYDPSGNEWIIKLYNIVNIDKHEDVVDNTDELARLAETTVPRVAKLVTEFEMNIPPT